MKPLTRRWLLAVTAGSLAGFLWHRGRRGQRPPLLRSFVENDYDPLRLVNVGGWLVSATEARLWSES